MKETGLDVAGRAPWQGPPRPQDLRAGLPTGPRPSRGCVHLGLGPTRPSLRPCLGEDAPAECAARWDWWRLEGFRPRLPGVTSIACHRMARSPSQRPPCQGPRRSCFTEQNSSANGVGLGRPADPPFPPPGPPLFPGRAERSVLSPDSEPWRAIPLPLKLLPVLFLLKETFYYGSIHHSPEQSRPWTPPSHHLVSSAILTLPHLCHGIPDAAPFYLGV